MAGCPFRGSNAPWQVLIGSERAEETAFLIRHWSAWANSPISAPMHPYLQHKSTQRASGLDT